MIDRKISELTELVTVDANDLLPIVDVSVDGFETKYVTVTNLALGAPFAPDSAQYVTMQAEAGLPNERILTGTANQVIVTDGGAGAAVTLSTPQDIDVTATPTFAGMTITGINGIDYNPGADLDVDIITIGVTGTPRVYWDESQDNIESTSHWRVRDSIQIRVGDRSGGDSLWFHNGTNTVFDNFTGDILIRNRNASGDIIFTAGNDEVSTFWASGGFSFGDTYINTDPGVDNVIIEGDVGIGVSVALAHKLHLEDTLTEVVGSNHGGLFDIDFQPAANSSASASAFTANMNVRGAVNQTNATAGVAGLRGIASHVSSGTTALLMGLSYLVRNSHAVGIVTVGAGIRILSATNAGGGIVILYGMKIEDQTVGGTNYSIYTGSGLNSFGDDLEFRQASTISTTAGDLTLDPAQYVLVATGHSVGIGTTTPAGQLEIANANNLANVYITSYSDAATHQGRIDLRRSRGIVIGTPSTTNDGNYLGGLVAWGVNTGNAFDDDAGRFQFIQDGAAQAIRIPTQLQIMLSSTTVSNQNVLTLRASTRVGIMEVNPSAQLHIDQPSTTAAIPVLYLDQADIDVVLMKIVGTAEAASADRTLVADADFGTPGALVGWIQIEIEDIGNRIADADYWMPFYAVPT